MKILIDGYNLLHVAGILGRSMGRRSLEKARLALLNRLSNLLDPDDRKETVVVFDAKDAPRHLPTEVVHKDITVRFARDFEEADDLLHGVEGIALVEAVHGGGHRRGQIVRVKLSHV